MQRLVFILAFGFAAGCSGGGGESSNTTGTESGRAIGQRNLPGYAVEVTQLGLVAPARP